MDIKDIFTTSPGKIVEYDAVKQLATVKLCIDRIYSTSTEDNLVFPSVVIPNVPVFTAGGGGYHLTFPVAEGDNCLVHFSQRGYDHWLYGDLETAPPSQDGVRHPWVRRMFNIADGFCQVGWNNIPTAIDGYSATDSEWKGSGEQEQVIALREDGSIDVKSGKAVISIDSEGNITMKPTASVTITGSLTVTEGIVGKTVKDENIFLGTHVHQYTDLGDAKDAPNDTDPGK